MCAPSVKRPEESSSAALTPGSPSLAFGLLVMVELARATMPGLDSGRVRRALFGRPRAALMGLFGFERECAADAGLAVAFMVAVALIGLGVVTEVSTRDGDAQMLPPSPPGAGLNSCPRPRASEKSAVEKSVFLLGSPVSFPP